MMLSSARSRITALYVRSSRLVLRANYSASIPRLSENRTLANDPTPGKQSLNISATGAVTPNAPLWEEPKMDERSPQPQAPNRAEPWARGQQPREEAMTGPRFEQTIIELQPQPHAAIELIHRQPVRWQRNQVIECDGGGGPMGHPRIFINVDKPQICYCTYCGLPYAHEQHRKFLESLPSTTYPLEPTGDPA